MKQLLNGRKRPGCVQLHKHRDGKALGGNPWAEECISKSPGSCSSLCFVKGCSAQDFPVLSLPLEFHFLCLPTPLPQHWGQLQIFWAPLKRQKPPRLARCVCWVLKPKPSSIKAEGEKKSVHFRPLYFFFNIANLGDILILSSPFLVRLFFKKLLIY